MEDTNERIKNILDDTELLRQSMEIINELVLAQEENIIISNEYKDYNNSYI
jgi:hypothetical protein